MRVALVRHPKPLIEAGLCYGRLDIALHADGLAELPRIAAALAGFAGAPVRCSPARRCATVAAALTRCPVPDERLLELDFGAWEGRPWDSVDRASLDRWAADPWTFAPPGGESGAALVARVRAFHAMLLADGRDCVVVAHGGPLNVLAALLARRDVDLLAPPMALGEVAVSATAA